jgi:parvulin-like peptidyl-prolyl isomerase
VGRRFGAAGDRASSGSAGTLPAVTRIPLLLVAAAVVFVVGCGQSRSIDAVAPRTAATITGGPTGETTQITRAQLEEVVDAIVGSDPFRNAVFPGGTLPDGFRQTLLSRMIERDSLEDLADELGAEVRQADRQEILVLLEEELAGLLAQTGAQDQTDQVLADIAPYTEVLVERNSLLRAVGRALTEGQDPGAQEVACVRHILVADDALAQELLAQLQAGADFAALAEEHSTDPGSGAQGGDLGCSPADRYVPEFAQAVIDAPLGEVVGPVETQFGHHLILVEDRTTEEIAVDELTPAGDALQQRLSELDITVSDDIGRWDDQLLTVVGT